MTVQLKHRFLDTAILRFCDPDSKDEDVLFTAKCGIINLMDADHPSLSELYKIRFNEYGGLQFNNYQKILKKRLSDIIDDAKEYKDLQTHILIPQYTGNYFNVLVLVSSLQLYNDELTNGSAFKEYTNFAVQHSNLVPLHLDQMNDDEIRRLLKISETTNNNGDITFQLSVDIRGIPDFLFEEYRMELGVHEIEVLQDIINLQVQYYDLPSIQLSHRYARSIGWDMNDQLISIAEPRRIATFGNERILQQALLVLESFHLQHRIRKVDNINPKNGKRTEEQQLFLRNNTCYLLFTKKAQQWEETFKYINWTNKYHKEVSFQVHKLNEIGVDTIQLFHKNRDLLIEIIRSWVSIANSKKGIMYEMESLLELFDQMYKTYGIEQINEVQLKMFLKTTTFDDFHEVDASIQNTLVSKYSPIFSHPFFNYKEKLEIGSGQVERKLWKKDIFSPGIHVIDISDTTQHDMLAIQAFIMILQGNFYFDNTWTLHSFGEGLRHSYEKVEQVLSDIKIHQSVIHFTHVSNMPSFLKNHELMLFDKDFSTYRVLKSYDANTLFDDSGDSSLLVYEQVDATLMKSLTPHMLDTLYDRNVMVKLPPKEELFTHDLFPAKIIEEYDTSEVEAQSDPDVRISSDESIFSRPFDEEEDNIKDEYEEDNYIGPELLFKIPIIATMKDLKQYNFERIEYGSNLPKDLVEEHIQDLISNRWMETSTNEGIEVFFPTGKGKRIIDDLINAIPTIKSFQDELLLLMSQELGFEEEEEERKIDHTNIMDALLTIHLSYHNMTSYDDRLKLLQWFSSLCRYVADKFIKFDDVLESYYFWSLGVYASFKKSQIISKRDEHLLIFRVKDIIKGISDIIIDRSLDDFTLEQLDVDTDEMYVFSEEIKEEEIELEEQQIVAPIEIPVPVKSVEDRIERVREIPSAPPTVSNIPSAPVKSFIKEKQLTPQQLKPIIFSRSFGGWYKFHRMEYDLPIYTDPMILSPDEIIFTFMVNIMSHQSLESFNLKKEMKTLMFLNEDQIQETVLRTPLPLKVNTDNLIESGVFEKADLGYSIVDIRTILPNPNVNVDPIYERMSLKQVLELIDEHPPGFLLSRTLQSFIYANQYDIELQPVVAICYALLVDNGTSQQKYDKFNKFIPWVYSLIKLHQIGRGKLMRSKQLYFFHESFILELHKIRVESILDLLEYTGDNDLAMKLKFLLQRKMKKLNVDLDDIKYPSEKQSSNNLESPETLTKRKTQDRTRFTPNLIQQIEEEALYETNKKEAHIKPIDRSVKTKKKKIIRKKSDEIIELTSQSDDEISFTSDMIESIGKICENAIASAATQSPKQLLISIFVDIIYPGLIDIQPEMDEEGIIDLFNSVGELTGVANTVEFSRNLGDMDDRWKKYEDTRERIIKSFTSRLKETAAKFIYNTDFQKLLRIKFNRTVND